MSALLDYSKPPPGYTVDGPMWSHPAAPSRRGDMGPPDTRNVARYIREGQDALAAAWAHYKAANDPPGCAIGLVMKGQGATERGFYCVDFWATEAAAVPAWKGDKVDASARFTARADAWAWHDGRHALARRCGRAQREWEHWPRCLTWTDADCNQIDAWLANGGALPEALRP